MEVGDKQRVDLSYNSEEKMPFPPANFEGDAVFPGNDFRGYSISCFQREAVVRLFETLRISFESFDY